MWLVVTSWSFETTSPVHQSISINTIEQIDLKNVVAYNEFPDKIQAVVFFQQFQYYFFGPLSAPFRGEDIKSFASAASPFTN